jgi:hypothetical protein
MRTIYRIHERNTRLQYYNNIFDYYTLNSVIMAAGSISNKDKISANALTL